MAGNVSTVSIVKGDEPYEMISKIFDYLRIEGIVGRGDRVVVKPNMVGERNLPRKGDQTSTEAVEDVVRALRERTNPDELIIAEGSGTRPDATTFTWFAKYGVIKIARKYHARLVDLNYDRVERVDIPDGYILKSMWAPKTILDAEVVISLPVLKIWNASAVSLNVKNVGAGCIPSFCYDGKLCALVARLKARGLGFEPDTLYGQSKTLSAVMVDVYSVKRPNIGIIDSLTVMHNTTLGAPTLFRHESVQVEELGTFIAGTDAVATDAVGCAVMGFDPQKIIHLNMAAEKRLGTNDLKNIRVQGKSIEELRKKCIPPGGMEAILANP